MIVGFKKEFAKKIIQGSKRRTIRRVRKRRPIAAGDVLHLYTGARTPNAEQFAMALCSAVVPVRITDRYIYLNGTLLPPHDAENFAQLDGFLTFEDMLDFFRAHYSLPFDGVVVGFEGVKLDHSAAMRVVHGG